MDLHDTTYIWGVFDTLRALGINAKEIENLKWVKRLTSMRTNAVAYEKIPSAEEAREMRNVVLKVNPSYAGAND